MELRDDTVPAVTVQQYGSKPTIAGVELIPLMTKTDDGGYFVELARLDQGTNSAFSSPVATKQISLSQVVPGAIKAYHLHKLQDDIWFVPPADKLLVNLHDVRKDSETSGVHMRLILGAGAGQALRIPVGVAHGVSNPYSRAMHLIYTTSEQFSAENPDEFRLPWDHFGASLWELTKG